MHAAFEPYTNRLDRSVLPPLNVDYATEIRDAEVWVAESGASLVGAIIVEEVDDSLKIANIAVDPDFQGNGLGRGLLEFAESEARRRGYGKMILATHSALDENLSLYLHLGWAEVEKKGAILHMSKPVG